MRRRTMLALAVVLLRLLGASTRAVAAPRNTDWLGTTIAVPGGSYRAVTPTQLAHLLRHKQFLLINVHIPYAGEIARTDLFIPYNTIDRHLASLPASRHAMIVLYCHSGRMSDIAARRLVLLGFTGIRHLAGGMEAWQQQGFPLLHHPRR